MKKYVENMKKYEGNMKTYEGNMKEYVENMKKCEGNNVGLRRIPGLPAGGREILRGRGHNSWDGPQYRKGRRVSRQKVLLKLGKCKIVKYSKPRSVVSRLKE